MFIFPTQDVINGVSLLENIRTIVRAFMFTIVCFVSSCFRSMPVLGSHTHSFQNAIMNAVNNAIKK